jgi:tRNA threonylcarbamoyladenosine biosynthesis protein TsaE
MATDNPVTLQLGVHTARSIQETAAIAAELLPLMLKSGVVSLEGPLGAGKTHFVKATALAMGITEDVTSPTFTLLQSYGSGDKRLHHSDWYRLESESEVLALGLEDYYHDGLMFIEWGDKFASILPPRTLRIRIEPQIKGTEEIRTFRWEIL